MRRSSSPTWGPLPCVRTRSWPARTRSTSGGRLRSSAVNHSWAPPPSPSPCMALPPMASTSRRGAWSATHGPRGGGKGLHRLLEAGERRADHAGADLARAGHLARHAGIDERGDARLHDLADVDADRRAAVTEGRDPEMRVLAEADLGHLLRHRDGLLQAA